MDIRDARTLSSHNMFGRLKLGDLFQFPENLCSPKMKIGSFSYVELSTGIFSGTANSDAEIVLLFGELTIIDEESIQ